MVAPAQPRRAVGMMMAAVGAASMPSQEEGTSTPKKRTRRKAQEEEEPEESASDEFDFVELPKARKGSMHVPFSMHVTGTARRRQLADAPCLLHVHSLPITSKHCFDRSSWLALGCTPASMVGWRA